MRDNSSLKRAGLGKGEVIIKDQIAYALMMGSKYKKICVTHLI